MASHWVSDVFCICKHAGYAGYAFSFGLNLTCQDPGADDRTQPLLSLYWAWKAWNFGDLNVVGGQHFLTLGGLEMSGNVSIFQLWSRKIRSGC